jgi:hypothetical protein
MTSDALRSIRGHRRFLSETPLNRRLDAAYQKCLDRGGHLPSGQTVQRDFGNHQRNLPICRRCGCPYGGPRMATARQRWNGTDGGAVLR